MDFIDGSGLVAGICTSSAVIPQLVTTEGFNAAGAMVKPEDLLPSVRISDNTNQHLEWLMQDIEAGVSHLYLHIVNTKQLQFIDAFGEVVLPHLISA